MKGIFIQIVTLTLIIICTSCDDREESFFELDTAPKITILDARYFGDVENYVIDSLKTSSTNGLGNYQFRLLVEDKENNASNIRYETVAGIAQLIYGDSDLTSNEALDLKDRKVLELTYKPFTELSILNIILSDKLGKEDSVYLEVRTFDNLPPIARLEVREFKVNSQYEYLLDASQSIDLDEFYGGEIVKYRYKINQKEFTSFDAEARFIFPGSGNYAISVSVEDNDGVISESANQILTIP